MSKVFVKARVTLQIPENSTQTQNFENNLVKNRVVKVTNQGPGQISVTRSVSANGVDFTILPGAKTIAAGKFANIELPSFANFTQLGISTFAEPATVVLSWLARGVDLEE